MSRIDRNYSVRRALAGAHWRVTLNGSAVPRGLVGRAVVRNGIVYGTVKHGGLMIIVR